MPNYLEKFENDKQIIIQAFINFYGIIYSDYIKEKINNVDIVWYDSTPIKESENIYNCIYTKIPRERMDYYLSKRKKKVFLQSAYIDEFNILVLPQNYDINQIIHELNHMLSTHILSSNPYAFISGICYGTEKGSGIMQENKALDEVINELMTRDILEELRLLGLEVNYSESWQEKCFPLVETFYRNYKESLKNLYISGNLKQFLNQFDTDIFQEFSQIMFIKLFRIQNKISNGEKILISEDEVNTVEELIDKMIITSQNKKI